MWSWQVLASRSIARVERARIAVAMLLVSANITADAISIAGVAISAGAGLLVWRWHGLGAGAVLFLLGSTCDAVDGAVARLTPRRPGYENGPMVDCICDKLGELLFMGGLALACAGTSAIRFLALAASLGLLTAYVKAASAECGLMLRWNDVRVVGRTGRVVILGGGLFVATRAGLGIDHSVIAVAAALSLFNTYTLILRVQRVIRRGGAPRLMASRTGA